MATLFPLCPTQHTNRQCPSAARWVTLLWGIPKAPPPYNLSAAPRQRNIAQMKKQSITSELHNEEIANISDGEFKALVMKMLTDLIELGQKMKKNK